MAASSARMPTTSAGMGSQSVPGVSADGRFWGAPQCGQVGAVSCSVVPQPRQKLMVGLSGFGGDYRMIGLLNFAVVENAGVAFFFDHQRVAFGESFYVF